MLSLSSYFSLPFMWKGSLILMSRWDLGRYCAQGGLSSFEFYLLRGRNSPGLIHKNVSSSPPDNEVSVVSFFTSSAGLSLTGWLNWSTSFSYAIFFSLSSYAIFFFSLTGLYVDSLSQQFYRFICPIFCLYWSFSCLFSIMAFFWYIFLLL